MFSKNFFIPTYFESEDILNALIENKANDELIGKINKFVDSFKNEAIR